MTPREYEQHVARLLESEGWHATLSSYTGDMGVDIIASKGDERIAVQVKMYGGSARPVNTEMVMALHGAAAYFECTAAMIATDGRVLDLAATVAMKLGIEIRRVSRGARRAQATPPFATFDTIWRDYVFPLAGRTLRRANGGTNTIVSVDWAKLSRITSSGGRQDIKIEIFERVIDRLLAGEVVTREWIDDAYAGRASSGVVLVLSQVPLFEVTQRPVSLQMKSIT